MPALQVRDLPYNLYEELKATADQDRRSVAQQTIVILQDYLNTRKGTTQEPPGQAFANNDVAPLDGRSRAKRRAAVFELIDQLPPLHIPDDFPDDVALIREERERR